MSAGMNWGPGVIASELPYLFGFAFRWCAPAQDAVALKLFVSRADRGYGKPHWGSRRAGGVAVSGTRLLGALAQALPLVGRDFTVAPPCGAPPLESAFDLGAAIGRPDLPGVVFEVRDRRVIIMTPHGRCDAASESVIVVEALAAFGDALVAGVQAVGDAPARAAVEAWERARATVDVLPMDLFGDGLPDGAEHHRRAERAAAFYARQFGVDVATYRRTAIWLMAEQGRRALGERADEPDWCMPLDGSGDVPGESEVMALAERVAPVYSGLDELITSALWTRNDVARAALYYHGWPDSRAMRCRPAAGGCASGDRMA